MPNSQANVSQIAHIILRRLRVCQCLIWLGILLVLFVILSVAFAGLCLSGLSPAMLNFFAWTGLICTLSGCLYGCFRTSRDERLFPLMKENILQLYPDQRKDFDAWLATELYAPDGEATWKLINRRLQNQVPPGRPAPLLVFPKKLLWLLIPGLILVLSVAIPGKPQECLQVYFRRLWLGHDSRPLQLVSVKPDRRWIIAGDALELDLLFDREVEGNVSVIIVYGIKCFVD